MNQNPIQMAVQMMKMGQNPMSALQQMAGTSPQLAKAMQLISGKTPQQLKQMARNMANECGIDLDDFVRSLGITVPSSR